VRRARRQVVFVRVGEIPRSACRNGILPPNWWQKNWRCWENQPRNGVASLLTATQRAPDFLSENPSDHTTAHRRSSPIQSNIVQSRLCSGPNTIPILSLAKDNAASQQQAASLFVPFGCARAGSRTTWLNTIAASLRSHRASIFGSRTRSGHALWSSYGCFDAMSAAPCWDRALTNSQSSRASVPARPLWSIPAVTRAAARSHRVGTISDSPPCSAGEDEVTPSRQTCGSYSHGRQPTAPATAGENQRATRRSTTAPSAAGRRQKTAHSAISTRRRSSMSPR